MGCLAASGQPARLSAGAGGKHKQLGAAPLTPACCTGRQHSLSFCGQVCFGRALHSGVVGEAPALRGACAVGPVWTLRWLLTRLKRYDALIYPQSSYQSLVGGAQAGRGKRSAAQKPQESAQAVATPLKCLLSAAQAESKP